MRSLSSSSTTRPTMLNCATVLLILHCCVTVGTCFHHHHVGVDFSATATTTTFQKISLEHGSTTTTKRTATTATTHPSTRRSFHTTLYMSIPTPIDTLTSGLASIVRFPNGVTVVDSSAKKKKTITIRKLYDIENDPNCRLVRERITELDLVVESVIPSCTNSRIQVASTLPQMAVAVSNNNEEGNGEEEDKVLVGVEEILSYLNTTCLEGEATMTDNNIISNEEADTSNSPLATITAAWDSIPDSWTSQLASLLRAGRGSMVSKAALSSSGAGRPLQKMILYNYEGNQFCRLVREVLTELDLEYEMRTCGKGSPRREELASISIDQSSQCPQLIDPNSKDYNTTPMKESKDIIEYLYRTYAQWTPPNEVLQVVSGIITPLLKPIYAKLAPMQAGSGGGGEGYDDLVGTTQKEIDAEIQSAPIVVYTYSLSPFCTEAMDVLKRLDYINEEQDIKEISVGYEWIPGLIQNPMKRAALGDRTGQTSLPHIFVGGQSIGGLFSGTPGLISSLEDGTFPSLVQKAKERK